jgi:hypothetical protein
MVDFQFSPGLWKFDTIQECPGPLFFNDIHGQRCEIRCFEVSHAKTTLGVDIAPDGNNRQQFQKLMPPQTSGPMGCKQERFCKLKLFS